MSQPSEDLRLASTVMRVLNGRSYLSGAHLISSRATEASELFEGLEGLREVVGQFDLSVQEFFEGILDRLEDRTGRVGLECLTQYNLAYAIVTEVESELIRLVQEERLRQLPQAVVVDTRPSLADLKGQR